MSTEDFVFEDEDDVDWVDSDDWNDDLLENMNSVQTKPSALLPIDSIISINDIAYESLVNGYLNQIIKEKQSVPLCIINLCYAFYLNDPELHRADDFIHTLTETASRNLGVPS